MNFVMSPSDWMAFGALLIAMAVLFYVLRKDVARKPAPISNRPLAVPEPPQILESTPPKPEIAVPVELLLGGTPDAPVIAVSAIDFAAIPGNARQLDLQHSRVGSLSPLLQAVPSVLAGVEFASGKYMKVVVDGSLARAGDGTSYMPFVRGPDGKVTELARLQDPTRLGSLVNGAQLWQLASVVVAQKHLADISQKLDAIKSAIDEVGLFQKAERRSVAQSVISYLEQFVDAARAGELSDALRGQIESNEKALLGVQIHLESEMRMLRDRIQSIKGEDKVGSKDLFAKLSLNNSDLASAANDWSLCVGARLMNWYMLACYAGDAQIKESRLAAIRRSVDAFLGPEAVLGDLKKIWQKRLKGIDAFWNLESTLELRRKELRNEISRTHKSVEASLSRMKETIQDSRRILPSMSKPLSLAVKVENGRIVEAYDMEENSTRNSMQNDSAAAGKSE